MSSKAPPLSTTPPPPPGGGSGKYLAVVVLLGLGLAALLFWKSCGSSSSAGPIAVTPVTSSTPSALPAIADDIPPPPVIEDSGTETHTPHSFSGGNGCEQKSCSGTVTSDLETALAFRAKQAHRCYDSALAQDTTLQGHVKISVRVGYNGAVCGASVASNDLANSNVANCIANMFRGSGHFPTPKGGCVNTDVPIALMPPGQH
jgi:hypothetical protein